MATGTPTSGSRTLVVTAQYTRDLIDAPKSVQEKVVRVASVLARDPERGHGHITKLTGYDHAWRVRLGDWRLIYSFSPGALYLYRLFDRQDDYDDPDPGAVPDVAPPPAAAVAEARALFEEAAQAKAAAAAQATVHAHPAGPPLPRELTVALLSAWHIPQPHHGAFLRCRTGDELMGADAPQHLVQLVLEHLYPSPLADVLHGPKWILDDEAQHWALLEGRVRELRLELGPEQLALATASGGPHLVKGGPGTGKSLVALYRVRHLVKHPPQPLFGGPPRVLFVSYTNALVLYARSLLQALLGDDLEHVDITTADALARRVVDTHGDPPGTLTIASDVAGPSGTCLERALRTVVLPGDGPGGHAHRRAELRALGTRYLLEEFDHAIDGCGVTGRAGYLTLDRAGRGTPLTQRTRKAVWAAYESWCAELERTGHTTFNRIARSAYPLAEALDDAHKYDAVIVDEAQDLAPLKLRLLRALCRDPQGLYLTADATQSLYERGFSWKRTAEVLGAPLRAKVLTRNYRNTREILAAALPLVQGTGVGDRDTIAPEHSAVRGPTPTLFLHRNDDECAAFMAKFLRDHLRRLRFPWSAGAVLVRRSHFGDRYAALLRERGIPAEWTPGKQFDPDRNVVSVMTLHSSKGLQFPVVIAAAIHAGIVPLEPPTDASAEERAELERAGRRLLFVGLTRAMRALAVTAFSAAPSPLLAQADAGVWDVVRAAEAERSGGGNRG